MHIFRSLAGLVRVELTSADLPGAFGALSDREIPLFDTEQRGDLSCTFFIYRRDFRQLKALCEKRGDRARILSRAGVYWTMKSLLKRPVLLTGMLLLLLTVLYLPSRVFFVQVEGNTSVPTRLILAAAEESGICFGASRREVRSERVKNALLEAVPELQWAGVNTYGCVAVISVRERSVSREPRQEAGFGNIVAVRDGVITSCTATKGNLICGVGQAVTVGEVLISGYTDCGICIQAVQAEGEVYAQTRRDLTAVMPSNLTRRVSQTGEKQKISLLIGKNRINLWKDSGIYDTSCGRMYSEYYITLPGGFQLPVALIVETYAVWECSEEELPRTDAEEILADYAQSYLQQQMVAGTIRSASNTVVLTGGCYGLRGEYVCVEMIGKMQREQIGE